MVAVGLVELFEAASRAHTETTLVREVFAVLERRWNVRSLTLTLTAPRRRFTARSGASVRGGRTIALPLADVGGGGRGDLQLVLASPRARDSPTKDDLALMGRTLAAALRQLAAIHRVADLSRRAHARVKQLDEEVKDVTLPRSLVAVAPATRRIFTEIVPLVARRDTTVLVLGETGTGKEIVAHRIHQLSLRARRAFVRINCGAIPSDLVESTLFGHEPGSFTGAVRRHIGVFERAHGGTLFLDEVAELPLAAQVKLLRVLESGEIERVGGDRVMHVDVRIVAATHRDLERRVAERTFRADLFHRLDVFPIRLPPLRERQSEIPALARQILGDLATRDGVEPPALDRTAFARLRAYEWPGNVRELRNVLERSLLLHRGERLEVDLPAPPRGATPSFADASRRAIEAALAASEGHIYGPNGAAELLKLKPTTLASKMKRLGVTTPRRVT